MRRLQDWCNRCQLEPTFEVKIQNPQLKTLKITILRELRQAKLDV